MEKEREALRFEVNKAGAQIKEADAAIAAQKAEIEKLNLIIGEADQVGCIAGNLPSCNHSPENWRGTPQRLGRDVTGRAYLISCILEHVSGESFGATLLLWLLTI